FWGPDCKGMCTCHPNGKCDDVTGKSPATVRKGNVTKRRGNAPAMPVTGGRSATTTATVASTQCATNPRAGASATLAGSAVTVALSARATTRLVSSLRADRCERHCQCANGKCNPVDGSCTCKPGYRGKL
ncbi:hypothetical protein M9458_012320, partial [Cirrhinus mrigala]